MAFTYLEITAAHLGQSVLFECADIQIEQKFTPTWNNTPSYGKMDGIPAYSNTTRKIDFSFILRGPQQMSMKQLNQNVDTLIKMQYPRYKAVGNGAQRTFAGAPFFIVKYLAKNPILTTSYLSLLLYTRLLSRKIYKEHHSLIEPPVSTKRVIYEK